MKTFADDLGSHYVPNAAKPSRKAYRKAMEVQSRPRLTDPLYSLAQMHEQAGDYAAAAADNEEILIVRVSFR